MAIPNPYGSLGTIWAEMGLDYSRFMQGTAEMQRRTVELERVTQQSLDRMADQWAKFGTRMSIAVTAPLTLTARRMTVAFAEYEQSLARAGAVASATEEELRLLAETARQLGADTQYSAAQAAEGMTYLAMAGFNVQQTIEAMPGVLQLAASAQLDLATAADITTNILTGYGLAVADLARVNDVLVSAMTGANTNLQQLGEAMKYAGPVASAAGVEFEEAAAAISLMSNAGIQGSMAGTSLRGALTRLLTPTGQVRDLIQQLGLNLYDANGNLLSMVEIVAELERSGASAGDMMILFGQRAGPAMQALVDQGSQALAEFVDRLRDSEGVAERIATMQMDVLRGSILELESAWEEMSLTLVDTVYPALRGSIDLLTEMIRWYADLPPAVQMTTIALGGLAAAAGPVALAMSAVIRSLGTLAGPVGLFMLAAGGLSALGLAYGSAVREQERFYEKALDSARALRDQADELEGLIRRYDALSGKPELSAEEHEELQQVMERIVEIQPEIAAGYDDISEALERNIDPLKRYTEALRTMSETELMVAALRAEFDIEHLRAERERLNQEIARLRERLGPEYERAIDLVLRSAQAQQLYNEAVARMNEGLPEDEALRPLREFLEDIATPGADMALVLSQLERQATEAMKPFENTAKAIKEAEEELAYLNERIAMAERVIKVYTEGWEALESTAQQTAEAVSQTLVPAVDTDDVLDDLYALLAEEQALWQARISLARYGARDVIAEFGTLEDVIQNYLRWLDDVVTDESLDELFRGRMADAARTAMRELERLQEEAADALGDMADMTAEEIVAAIMGMVDSYGPAAARLREAIAVGELPFIGDDLAEMQRRIENFYRRLVEAGQVSTQQHLQVLLHQMHEMRRAGEVGTDAWLRLAREIEAVSEQIQTTEDRRQRERQQAIDDYINELIELAEFEARLYRQTYTTQAIVFQNILDEAEAVGASARMQLELTRRLMMLRRQASDEQLETQERLTREEEAAAARAAEAAERQRQEMIEGVRRVRDENLRARDDVVTKTVDSLMRLADLEDWTAERRAQAIRRVLDTFIMSGEQRERLEWQALAFEKQAAEEAAVAKEAARRRELQAALDTAQHEAIIYRQSAAEQAEALRRILDEYETTADERLAIMRRIEQLEVRAAEEAAAAAERVRQETEQGVRRMAEEARRARDEAVQATWQSLRNLARLEQWSYERQAEALDRILRTHVMSSELREQLEWELLFLRQWAAEEASEAEERARRRALEAAIAEVEHKRRLYDWSAAQEAEALQHVLDIYETNAEERLNMERRIAELLAQHQREEAQRQEREAEAARRKEVQDAVAHVRFLSQLHEWSAAQQADALEEVLRTANTTAEEEADIRRDIALLRAQHERRAAEEERRIRRQSLQEAYEEARFLAELYDWTREQYIETLEQILRDHEDLGEERIRIERELALERKRLVQEQAEAERQALREAYLEAARLQIVQTQAAEPTIAAIQRQKDALIDLALHYMTLGEEAADALALVDEALEETQRRLDEAIAGHPAMQFIRQLEGVLSGRRTLGEAGMAWIDQQMGDAAARIIDDLSARTARFIDLHTSGAMDVQAAWQAAFQGMSISARDAYTLIIGEIIRLFTAASQARDRLRQQAQADVQRRIEDERRFARLVGLGFVGQFETTTRTYTERVSYLFGLFHENVTHSERVTSERTRQWLERMEELWADAQRRGQGAMQQAFQAPETAQLATFYRSLNVGVYESVRDGLIDAFTESQAYARLMAPLWQAIDEGIEDAFADGMFDPARFWRMVGPALARFQQEVELLEFPFREIQSIIREIEEMLGLPPEEARSSMGGTRLTALSGEQRDFFAELMRPVRYLDHMPQYHAEHMRRLDDIIGLLSAGERTAVEGFAAYIEQRQAALTATEIVVQHIASATFTGPVTLLADGQDIRRAVRRAMDEEYAAGAAAGRSTGL